MSTTIIGLGELLASVLMLGCMFVPMKKFGAGDGFFAQWIVNASFLLVGFVIFACLNFEPFYPLAMVGGACWAIANMMAIPIISRLGMCLGILIWNAVNCVVGFVVTFVGLFGIESKPTSTPALSFVGLGAVLVGGVLFGFVKNCTQGQDGSVGQCHTALKINMDSGSSAEANNAESGGGQDKKCEPKQRAVGFVMAFLSGVLYAMNLLLVLYIQDNPEKFKEAPKETLPYVFSHTFGAFVASTLGFAAYAFVRKNKPSLNPRIVLPALSSGILLGVAQALNFLATESVSGSITYPIGAMVPGCIAALWDVFYFREITGRRNLVLLTAAVTVTLIGATLIGLSK